MPDPGAVQLDRLAARLRAAGTEGQGLRRELYKALKAGAGPVAKEIGSLGHLKPYLPDRYAAVLAADLDVSVRSSLSGDPKVTIRAQAREHRRKIRLFNDQGIINHPVFARGPRRLHGKPNWTWKNGQTGGMRAGFFDDPCRNAEPDIRGGMMQALRETGRKIAGGT